jgi:hypothetical protein
MIEIFSGSNYDFLSKKWICLAISCAVVLIGAGAIPWRALDGNPNTQAPSVVNETFLTNPSRTTRSLVAALLR